MVAECGAECRNGKNNQNQRRQMVDSGSLPKFYIVPSSLSFFKRGTKLTRRMLAENATVPNFVLRPWSSSQPKSSCQDFFITWCSRGQCLCGKVGGLCGASLRKAYEKPTKSLRNATKREDEKKQPCWSRLKRRCQARSQADSNSSSTLDP